MGSLKTPSPSARETPCFLRFTAFFFGSNVGVARVVYAHNAYYATAPLELGGGLMCGELTIAYVRADSSYRRDPEFTEVFHSAFSVVRPFENLTALTHSTLLRVILSEIEG